MFQLSPVFLDDANFNDSYADMISNRLKILMQFCVKPLAILAVCLKIDTASRVGWLSGLLYSGALRGMPPRTAWTNNSERTCSYGNYITNLYENEYFIGSFFHLFYFIANLNVVVHPFVYLSIMISDLSNRHPYMIYLFVAASEPHITKPKCEQSL